MTRRHDRDYVAISDDAIVDVLGVFGEEIEGARVRRRARTVAADQRFVRTDEIQVGRPGVHRR